MVRAIKSIDEYIQIMRDQGIRITEQRVGTLEYLIEYGGHPTATEIYQAMKKDYPNMSIATVYNNLYIFVELGFVMELTLKDQSTHFDLTDRFHYHVVCTECGKVADFYLPMLEQIEERVSQATEFQVNSHRLEAYGLCKECQSISAEDKK